MFVLFTGLLLAYAFLGGDTPAEMATRTSWIVGCSLLIGLIVETKIVGIRQMIRADVAALAAIYFLTIGEFLVNQPVLNLQLTVMESEKALSLVLLGIAALAIGRFLVPPPRDDHRIKSSLPKLKISELFVLMILCFSVGELHKLVAVGFNPVELFRELTDIRFAQSWQRGRYGGWGALIYELGLLTYLIPPCAAILLVKWREMPITLPVVILILGFEFFAAFSLGSRHVLFVHIITFCAAFGLSLQRLTIARILGLGIPAATLLFIASILALEFRNDGLRDYLNERREGETKQISQPQSINSNLRFMLDNNLRSIAEIAAYIPERHDYLREEMIIRPFIQPIPRAIWSGKPKTISLSAEQIMGRANSTIAATFVGEAYMAWGEIAVVVCGVVIGVLCGLWNRLGMASDNRTLLLLFVAGFFWITIGMRSPIWILPCALPSFALFCYAKFVIPIFRGPVSPDIIQHPGGQESGER